MDDLIVLNTTELLNQRLRQNDKKSSVALVPTMGALHDGHLELVKKAVSLAGVVVVSIFVNPIQFNKKEDFENYPRTLDNDISVLKKLGSNIVVFAPNYSEIYPDNYNQINLDLGHLGAVMEGKYRPGHFQGVVNVVKRLLDIVKPKFSVFGLKDYQQIAVIKFMVNYYNLNTEIITCNTYRENSGLALSSRNRKLSNKEKEDALVINETMILLQILSKRFNPIQASRIAQQFFNRSSLKLEYLCIIDPDTLEEIDDWVPGARSCIAAYCGEVRLIDNMELISLDRISEK
ncbi:MAG: pantoate--beta-alanine ligase [Crocinitomicaceae bacterium]|nr:pantoate--beta-alanine ligase [Crocinitomicaceae bacterium]|tara:strand:+ start:41776 stop:42645 length:870 start_codon:yes stop_codon:yes gene_type:complete